MWTIAFFCTLAILFLGYVLGAYRGIPTTGMVAWLTACIASLAFPLVSRFGPEADRRAQDSIPFLLTGCLGMFAAYQLTLGTFSEFFRRYDIAIWLLAVIAISLYLGSRGEGLTLRLCRTRVFPVLLIGFLFAGFMTIRNNPHPTIDVFELQQAGCDALLHGKNPYTASIPDLYGPASPYYIPLFENGRSLFGFAYPPLIALLEIPAYVLTGDVRYTHLLAFVLSACLIAAMRNSWLSLAGAAMFLVNPAAMAIIQYAWIEPIAILLLSATLFSVSRYPRLVPGLFGLFLTSKQTHVFLLPLFPLLMTGPLAWKPILRFLVQSLAVAILLILPFYFWNPHAFVTSLATVQLKVPLRQDLISYPAYFARRGWFLLPVWLPFLYLPFGWYLCLRRAPRTLSGFAFASALIMIVFVALSKQGSPNYYFLVLGALCCALATTEIEPSPAIIASANVRHL